MDENRKQKIKVNTNYKEKYGFNVAENYVFKAQKGLNEDIVRQISKMKNEPGWMTEFRLKSYRIFADKPTPEWGGDLSKIDYDEIYYYLKPTEKQERSWDDVPAEMKETFDRLGIPEAERQHLAGVKAQFDSEVIYGSLMAELEEQGIIFMGTDEALQKHPEIFEEYFGKLIPPSDNKFAALNSAVWSGGSFVYIPKGVHVKRPLQAYFRINAMNMGQFERTLIIADEGSYAHYVEGCTAPVYSANSLHAAVVEVFVKPTARFRYTTIQNWSPDVYNLVTKRAKVEKDGVMEWVDGNLGCLTGDSKVFLNNKIKNIKDVKADDYVYCLDENFNVVRNRVVATKYSGEQQIYKLTTANSRSIKATANHPFLVLRKFGKHMVLKWLPLEAINSSDLVAISGTIPDRGLPLKIDFTNKKGTKKNILVPNETTDDLMWLLGFYIGDGYYDRNRVYFAVPETDPSHFKVGELLEKMFGLNYEIKGNVIRTSSVNFKEFIMELGFTGNARTKRIPEWVYTLPQSQRMAFINGYIDADGYRRHNHKNISITSVNKELLEDVKTLAITCGLNPTKISKWTRVDKKPLGIEPKQYTHYFLYFGEQKFENELYFSKVSGIEPLGVEPTYDIEVEGAHNFIANGFFVHNSKLTMKYPSCYLVGEGAHGEVLSIAYASENQHQDAGAKMIHTASNTSSTIVSKSISVNGGRTSYRGLVTVTPSAKKAKSRVECDALILDSDSASDTFPTMKIDESSAQIEHEATVSKIGEEKMFYLMSRGLTEVEAMSLIVSGFIEPIVKELPLEYAVELNRLIELEMEGSVG